MNDRHLWFLAAVREVFRMEKSNCAAQEDELAFAAELAALNAKFNEVIHRLAARSVERANLERAKAAAELKQSAKSNHELADQLTKYVQVKAPAYSVRWNPDVRLMPEDPQGAFEIGIGDKVHYRRRSPLEVIHLVNKNDDLSVLGEGDRDGD